MKEQEWIDALYFRDLLTARDIINEIIPDNSTFISSADIKKMTERLDVLIEHYRSDLIFSEHKKETEKKP